MEAKYHRKQSALKELQVTIDTVYTSHEAVISKLNRSVISTR